MKQIILALICATLLFGCGVSKNKYNSAHNELTSCQTALVSSDNARSGCESRLASLTATTQQLEEKTKTYSDLVSSLENEINSGKITISEMKDRLTVNLIDKILFDSGETNIQDEGKQALSKVAEVLKGVQGKRIQVEGHTDNVPLGPTLQQVYPTNWELSTTRATAVVRYLARLGVPQTKLSGTGYGMWKPVTENKDEAGRRQNRRIEIVLVPDLQATTPEPQIKEEMHQQGNNNTSGTNPQTTN